ncbi:MAG: hypothetical protein JO250_07090 [Armatimonadetes bacterium]|nr:hypothetical protein [Armatimonadota bacterium]
MRLQPEYAENIIVATIYQGAWAWYVTYRDDWFLDRVKWGQAFGHDAEELLRPEAHKERYWIPIVNEHTAGAFLKALEVYRVGCEELAQMVREEFLTAPDWDDAVYDLLPSVLVNFDERWLKSIFPEPSGTFEMFVPDRWRGEYVSFLGNVPPEQRYWVIDGRDYFAGSPALR